MTASNWLSLAAIVAMVAIAVWQAFRVQSQKDAKAQWTRITDLEREVNTLRTQVATLHKAMEFMPSGDVLNARLQALADRMEKRLDDLGKLIQDLLLEMAGSPRGKA